MGLIFFVMGLLLVLSGDGVIPAATELLTGVDVKGDAVDAVAADGGLSVRVRRLRGLVRVGRSSLQQMRDN